MDVKGDIRRAQDTLAAALALIERQEVEIEQERQKAQAVQIVLDALRTTLKPRGFDRRTFLETVASAGRAVPDNPVAAVQHAILLAEARKVIGMPPG